MNREPHDVELTVRERLALASTDAVAARDHPDLDAGLAGPSERSARPPGWQWVLAGIGIASALGLVVRALVVVVSAF